MVVSSFAKKFSMNKKGSKKVLKGVKESIKVVVRRADLEGDNGGGLRILKKRFDISYD